MVVLPVPQQSQKGLHREKTAPPPDSKPTVCTFLGKRCFSRVRELRKWEA